ncbi:MAG: hypothetical protein H0Z29_02840 [Candidatus Marinimicrobia bacterium]|nr:hypothetical protein [Candidatus Neomarinimicrobiota bacterium]
MRFNQNKIKPSRHAKEIGIQINEMEKFKRCCSREIGQDAGKKAYLEWVEKYGAEVREWLESLSDEEINKRYDSLPDRIKKYIEEKIR